MSETEETRRAAPIIVTALLGAVDFAWADALRRAHFPAERNHLPAHLTMFHHLPPSIERELHGRLREITRGPAPRAELTGVIDLGAGTAFRVTSPELAAIRGELADAFRPLLVPQDAAGWRAHITVQNKAPREAAVALRRDLEAGFRPRPIEIAGLAAWYYRGGPWEPIAQHRFARG